MWRACAVQGSLKASMSSEPLSDFRTRAPARLALAGIGPKHAVIAMLSAAIIAGLSYYHYYYEGWRETITYAGAITAALVAAVMFASRRVLFSLAVVACLIAMIVIASDVKRHYVEMVLHAYDVVFYLSFTSRIWPRSPAALSAPRYLPY
jgi:hypothetical protein